MGLAASDNDPRQRTSQNMTSNQKTKNVDQHLTPHQRPELLLLDEKLNALSDQWNEQQSKNEKKRRRKGSNIVPDYDWDRAQNASDYNQKRHHNLSYDRSSGPSPVRFLNYSVRTKAGSPKRTQQDMFEEKQSVT